MPSAPEFPDGAGEIGGVEIIRHPEAHDLCRADGEIGVAGEVPVNLEGEEHRRRHQLEPGVGFIAAENLAHRNGAPVGDHQLLEIPPEHPVQPPLHSVDTGLFRICQLRKHPPRPLDRPGAQQGKEGHEGSIPGEIPLRFQLAAINVKDIAKRLEGKEGNSHRQSQLQSRTGHTPLREHRLNPPEHISYKEGIILEYEQASQAQHQSQHQPEKARVLPGILLLPTFADGKPRQVGHKRHPEKQQGVHGLEAHVKAVADEPQHERSPLRRGQVVHQHRRREEQQKLQGIVEHRLLLYVSWEFIPA